jgi:hypothetical protein
MHTSLPTNDALFIPGMTKASLVGDLTLDPAAAFNPRGD